MLIAIDPGVRYFAAACLEQGTLKGCFMGKPWGANPLLVQASELVIEKPQVYAHARARNSDLVDLAIAAGQIARDHPRVNWYLPREWKGQTPKAVHRERIRACLSQDELRLMACWSKGKLLHLWDAVGLGLKYVGRLT